MSTKLSPVLRFEQGEHAAVPLREAQRPGAAASAPVEPLVSLLIAVKDEERYIRDSLDSVLGQSHANLEVIVVDDHSSDATWEIMECYSRRDPRLRPMRAEGRGKVSAFNQAWRHCRGEMIALFAGDDVMPPNSIAERVALLRQHGCEVGSGKVVSFSTNPKYDGIHYPRRDGPNYSGGALIMARCFASRVFPVPEELPNEDQWARLHVEWFADAFPWTRAVVSKYRIHDANSMAFGAPFSTKNRLLHRRSKVYRLFLDRYRAVLGADAIAELERTIRLNEFRSQGRVLPLLLMRHVGWRQKLAALSVCTPLLYRLRLLLEGRLLGR